MIVFFPIEPLLAHNIKTDKDVGVTFHIEPDHNPRAGEVTTAWFALTYQGGKSIPLEQCNCQVRVYQQSSQQKTAIVQPSLKAISVEQYQHIPATEIIFPQAGIYEVEISGSPKGEAVFEPFKLSYNVTVLAGKSKVDESVSTARSRQESSLSFPDTSWLMVIGVIILVGAIAWWLVKNNLGKK